MCGGLCNVADNDKRLLVNKLAQRKYRFSWLTTKDYLHEQQYIDDRLLFYLHGESIIEEMVHIKDNKPRYNLEFHYLDPNT